MAQTVIGMFDNSTEAEQAVEKLVSSGISRDRIDITDKGTGISSGSTGTSSSGSSDRDDDHGDNAITRFFKNLFGDDDNDADKYSKVASRATCIVTVHAQSNDEAEDAADILDDNGAVDVDERASEYGYGTSSGRGTTAAAGTTGVGAGVSALTDDDDDTSRRSMGTAAGTTGVGAGVSGLRDDDDDDTSRRGTASTAGTTGLGAGIAAAFTDDDDDTNRTRNTAVNSGDYTGTSDRTSNDESRKIQVIREDVEIGKREEQTGGARIRSRIVERPVEESVRLRQERVNVERTPVDRPASESDFTSFEEKDIEMVERAEVPVVNKQARVVEEVSLNKEVEEKTETVRETVRNTEVDVDNLTKEDVRNSSTDSNRNI